MVHRAEGFERNVVCVDRGTGYAGSRAGRRYSASHQNPATVVTGQTSFSATAPTFLLFQSAKATRIVVSRIVLSQAGTVAGGPIKLIVGTEATSRYASGGTEVVPQNMNAAETRVALASFRYNPTANAATALRIVHSLELAELEGTRHEIDFGDGLLIGATGSLLVYTWAATTGASWRFNFEFTEEEI